MLIAGATGALGRRATALAEASGYAVRGLARHRAVCAEPWPADALAEGGLHGCCEGMEVVLSALGASVDLRSGERRRFGDVGGAANRRLVAEAVRARVRRFVYVAAYVEAGYAATAYIRAHEDVVESIRGSGLEFTIVRPTAFFSALDQYVRFAGRGIIPLIGDGLAKTNPIHPADLAAMAVSLLDGGPEELAVGGPEILTRRGIGELAFRAVGREPRFLSTPPWMARSQGRVAGLFNPRLGELLEFATAVSVTDCVAPARGRQRLGEYFRGVAR